MLFEDKTLFTFRKFFEFDFKFNPLSCFRFHKIFANKHKMLKMKNNFSIEFPKLLNWRINFVVSVCRCVCASVWKYADSLKIATKQKSFHCYSWNATHKPNIWVCQKKKILLFFIVCFLQRKKKPINLFLKTYANIQQFVENDFGFGKLLNVCLCVCMTLHFVCVKLFSMKIFIILSCTKRMLLLGECGEWKEAKEATAANKNVLRRKHMEWILF